MDFGTIKQTLKSNEYNTLQEVIDDFELVFDNAILYNQEDSEVGKVTLKCREAFQKWMKDLSVEFYL